MAVIEDLDGLRSGARKVVATVVDGGAAPEPADEGPVAILVGDEGSGLPPDVVAASDARVTIPMATGSESLNAAVAGAVIAYALMAGRRPGEH